MALKRLQYLISGIFRPLDILGHEISLDNENANIQRYLTILADCRTLLLNLSSQVNDMRNTLGFQTINPTFKSTAAPTQKFYDASCRFSSSPSNSPDTLFLYSYAPLKLLSVLQFNVGSAKLLEYPQQNHVFLSGPSLNISLLKQVFLKMMLSPWATGLPPLSLKITIAVNISLNLISPTR
ncbi:hypothetical protein RMCBS344292_11637 [Rhizopus microsporus]|nr:hypothetical protein RMCBS344292_11637 [Rhizopus microsporus]